MYMQGSRDSVYTRYAMVVLIKGVFSDPRSSGGLKKDRTLNPVCKEIHGYSERKLCSVMQLLMIAE